MLHAPQREGITEYRPWRRRYMVWGRRQWGGWGMTPVRRRHLPLRRGIIIMRGWVGTNTRTRIIICGEASQMRFLSYIHTSSSIWGHRGSFRALWTCRGLVVLMEGWEGEEGEGGWGLELWLILRCTVTIFMFQVLGIRSAKILSFSFFHFASPLHSVFGCASNERTLWLPRFILTLTKKKILLFFFFLFLL
jgi:hypothetical protein